MDAQSFGKKLRSYRASVVSAWKIVLNKLASMRGVWPILDVVTK